MARFFAGFLLIASGILICQQTSGSALTRIPVNSNSFLLFSSIIMLTITFRTMISSSERCFWGSTWLQTHRSELVWWAVNGNLVSVAPPLSRKNLSQNRSKRNNNRLRKKKHWWYPKQQQQLFLSRYQSQFEDPWGQFRFIRECVERPEAGSSICRTIHRHLGTSLFYVIMRVSTTLGYLKTNKKTKF